LSIGWLGDAGDGASSASVSRDSAVARRPPVVPLRNARLDAAGAVA
jgi:hypothetical protein